jgi:hypothetical protein
MGIDPSGPGLSEAEFRRQCLEYADGQLYGIFDEMSDPKWGWVFSSAELERLRDTVCTALVRAMRDGNVLRVHAEASTPVDVRGHLAHLAKTLPKKSN